MQRASKRATLTICQYTRCYSKIVSKQEIEQYITKQDQSYTLIDVREPDEYKAGFIPTAKHLPGIFKLF